MPLRLILLGMSALSLIYDALTLHIIDQKRQEPLPDEVSDVYTKERWETFVQYKHDSRLPYLIQKGTGFLFEAVFLLSPFYQMIEQLAGGSAVRIVLYTVLLLTLLPLPVSLVLDWYRIFYIEQKYGLNHRTTGEFLKEQIVDLAGGLILELGIYSLLALILLNLEKWTGGFSVSLPQCILLMAGIAAVIFVFLLLASLFSWKMMRVNYTFVPLEDGSLKSKILHLVRDSRRKVRAIEVYNESKKSTSKNAFVFKLLFYRSIGIADNFINENAEEELLAVLSHEAGHLKHKPDVRNFLSWGLIALLFAAAVAALYYGRTVSGFESLVEASFGLSVMNPVLTVNAAMSLCTPLLFLIRVFRAYVSRCEEYEADRNAVKEGYGEELIRTFKTLSNDELIDVNPADLIEFLEYDHPGMYHRIAAIRTAMAEGGSI
ncbi:MAG: M48 family metalloprotease [Solobacterium sp.]|nr:M48 family metalloprotease [Solobacterium sp.]